MPRYRHSLLRAFSGASAFAPTQQASLVAWFRSEVGLFTDSAGTTAAVADGDRVGRWEDQSGLGNHLTQTTAGNRGTLKLAIKNNRNVVRFAGGTQCLNFTGAGLALAQNVGAISFWVTCVSSSSAADTRLIGWDNNATDTVRVCLARNIDSANAGILSLALRRLDADGRTTVSGGAASYVDGTWDIEGGLFDFTNNLSYLRKNGAQLASGTTGGAGSTSDTASVGACIGRAQGAPLIGDVGEVLVYQAIPSAANITNIETYLNNRWAIY